MSIGKAPLPRSAAYDKWLSDTRKLHDRQLVVDLLRAKYQLSLHETVGCRPEVVQMRQKRYHEHLAELKAQWSAEDKIDAGSL